MRDPLAWSVPLFRCSGVPVRLHVLFPVVACGALLHLAAKDNSSRVGDLLMMTVLLPFALVLLHEAAQSVAAHGVGGSTDEIVLWPLGGLGTVTLPDMPKAQAIASVGGPLASAAVVVVCAIPFLFLSKPLDVLDPFRNPFAATDLSPMLTWLGRTGWLALWLTLFNICIPAFPLCAGRLVFAALWARSDMVTAAVTCGLIGYGVALVLVMVSLAANFAFVMGLAFFLAAVAWRMLQERPMEEMSEYPQGYMEDDEEPQPQPGFWERRRLARDEKRRQREQGDDDRMDALLEKIAKDGKASLTEEEHRFLARVSERYRNKSSQ